ncbi:DegT/DnrJ/EryC1/StrS family aminotransferase [Viridibacillus arvi]|uniref:DegT/DnrJ/EryC1/StrS family aminotransferase n=1 Tax=Viridibacillus arvi TaxID=263475 RepID=UPI003D033D7E
MKTNNNSDATFKYPISKPSLTDLERTNVIKAYDSTWISSSGEFITMFEKDFAKYNSVNYGIAVSNGTTALHLAMEALNIGRGDEVIVPDLTFAATINAVLHAGATPIIVDIDKNTWCISVDAIKNALSERTKAIIPVHLYGQTCDMDEIMAIAHHNNLYVIEDCAEAHGAKYKNKKVGSIGHVGCFSFFANKIITTGEGGMCLTNDTKLAEKLCILRDHGMSREQKYFHEEVGYNYRMTNIQAAIGVAQLQRIDEILEKRTQIDLLYRNYLENIDELFLQENLPEIEKVTWLFSVLVKEEYREKLMQELKVASIDSRPFFFPLSEMPIYKEYSTDVKNSKIISKMGLNLPTYLELDKENIIDITTTIKTIIDEIRCGI